MSKILKVLIVPLFFVQTYSYSMNSCFSPERSPSGSRVLPKSADRSGLVNAFVLAAGCLDARGCISREKAEATESLVREICCMYSPAARGLADLDPGSAEKLLATVERLSNGKRKRDSGSGLSFDSHLGGESDNKRSCVPSPTGVAEACFDGGFSGSKALPIKDLASFFLYHRELALSLVSEIVGLYCSGLQSSSGKKSSGKTPYPERLLCKGLSGGIERLADILVSSDGQPDSSAAFGNLIGQVMGENETLCRIILSLGLVESLTVADFAELELVELGKMNFNNLKRDLPQYWNILAHKYLSTRDSTIAAQQQIIYQLLHYFKDLSLSSTCRSIDIGEVTICSSLILKILRDGIYSGCVNDKKVSGGSRDLCSGVDVAAGAISSSRARELVEKYYGEALKTFWQRCLIQNEEERASNGRFKQLFSFERKSPTAMLAYTLIMQMLREEEFTVLTYEESGHGSLAIRAETTGASLEEDPYYFIRFNSTAKPGDAHPNLGQIIINIEYVCGDQKLNGHLGIVDPRDMGIVFQRISKEITKVEPNSAKKRSEKSGGVGGGEFFCSGLFGGGGHESDEFCGLFGGGDHDEKTNVDDFI